MNTMKFKKLLRLTLNVRQQPPKMQHLLFWYWFSMALVLFGVLLLFLSLAGVFSNMEQKLSHALEIREESICVNIENHLDTIEAQGIALSEKVSSVIKDHLYTQPVSVLNDHPEELLALQQSIYPSLSTSLSLSPCSGAFVVLDATTNTQAPGAAYSRAGLYLRFAYLSTTKSAHQKVTLFRGIPEVAREIPLEMHNRWNLEFTVEKLPGYQELIDLPPFKRLADFCLWSLRTQVSETWEDAIFLTVPFLDGSGKIGGVCGMEINGLYFRLTYASIPSEFGNMITLFAPLEGDQLRAEKGMVGSSEGAYTNLLTSLQVKEGKFFNTYTCAEGTYVGHHQEINVRTASDAKMVVATLIPMESFASAIRAERTTWIFSALAFLVLAILFSLYLSKRFVKPILFALDSIQNNTWEETPSFNSYPEIDDLFDFLAEKDSAYEKQLHILEQEKQNAQLEIAQIKNKYESVQTEISRLAYTRKQEVDPDAYQQFLEGLSSLTPTERKVFGYYLDGKNVKEIMEIACIKESTLRYHNRNIYSKLGVNSLKQLLQYATLMKQQEKETASSDSPEKPGR